MEDKPKIYMVMAIATFLLYGVAMTFAYLEYEKYTVEPLAEYDDNPFAR